MEIQMSRAELSDVNEIPIVTPVKLVSTAIV